MSDLKPCPFCGGEAQIVHSENGWQLKQTHDDSCWLSDATTVKAVIGEWDETKAIEAWNSRAERTCKQEERGWCTEGDHARVWLTCGHDCMVPTVQDLPNYCPICGARRVGE